MANEKNNKEEVEKSLTLLDKKRDIPLYRKLEALGVIAKIKEGYGRTKEGARQFNQMLGDMGSSAYNLVGVPLNVIGKELGYSPGFSGERVMEDIFGWSGYKPRGDVEAPFGIDASRTPFKEQPLGELTKDYLDRNIAASDSTSLASKDTDKPYDIANISDERRTWLGEFWNLPEEERNRLMSSPKMNERTKAELEAFYPAGSGDPKDSYTELARLDK